MTTQSKFRYKFKSSNNYYTEVKKKKNCKKVNWELFHGIIDHELNQRQNNFQFSNKLIDVIVLNFISLVNRVAETTIGKTTSTSEKSYPAWWNDTCHKARSDKNHALNRLKKLNNLDIKVELKKLRAAARRTYLRACRESWINHDSSLNNQVSSSTIWNKIKKVITSKTVSQIIGFKKSNDNDLTMEELKAAIEEAKDKGPGTDGISYSFFQNLPPLGTEYLLPISNHIWKYQTILTIEKEAIVFPTPKGGKDPSDPVNYRPISFTCAMCKLFEKIANSCLRWILEKKHFFAPQ